jgi:hypothetical protein
MAEQQPSAPARRLSPIRRTTTGGVTHITEYQPNRYTIIGNHLVQHRELSLTAIGLASHIQSLPEGSPVDIRTLAARFPEGRDRIAEALRELERHGYIERVRERTPEGKVITRTYAYNDPATTRARRATLHAAAPPAVPEPPADPDPVPPEQPLRAERPAPSQNPAPVPAPARAPVPLPASSAPDLDRHRTAAALLADLRRTDDRLLLSERDVRHLAPAVEAWLERGVTPAAVHRTLAANLPPDLRSPAPFLAHRLRKHLPPPLPPTGPTPAPPPPSQNCDGCDRAFRAPEPGLCRDCREAPTAAAA